MNPIAPALPSSSLLLVRDGRGGLEVLMMQRAKTMRFAPGALVFPGGKVDVADAQNWRWQRYLQGNRHPMRDLAYRIAAARELYEEVGILLGHTRCKKPELYEIPFEKALIRESLTLGVEDMIPFAHWVTPETLPRRFDTYFYLIADQGYVEKHDGNEAISAKWVKPREILSDWEDNKTPLMFPTRLNLMKLARSSTVAAALIAVRQAPVVRTLPTLAMDGKQVNLTIPKETGFGVTKATERELSVEKPK
jgi:8-oxo-dGTP pyrophosphatase MutT (NUDIX family)